jgi:hypothetical protein
MARMTPERIELLRDAEALLRFLSDAATPKIKFEGDPPDFAGMADAVADAYWDHLYPHERGEKPAP